ncbi:F-box/FBD/LRR-repeat protein At1g13570-like isoform X2 [Lycium barbarum]|uniref:F-box/FBD/LRR-repeat protein At1g13570-like isoform X2 n=1 Tax=Lycium barbarum TaxID=112863 RepID=UPI00293E1741|nr:F-box/FBD/LRR-repeat protein At1g13570-like isoform X2 [Lycium barbarum]
MTTSGVDTISNLPSNILDGILGCLPLKDAVKTSILSKDWRYKWVTRQKLDFDEKNVQEFTLHIFSGNEYHLPSQIFTFQQLWHLELGRCLFHPPPDFKGFEKLINLDLQCVIFDPAIIRNLISKCPLLERLRLNWCTDFDIFEIDAANLKCFDFVGISKSICFKNTPMLRNVTVWLDSNVLTDPSPIYSNITKFFHYMPSLRELDLCGSTLEYLTMGGVPESPPTALNNVGSLRISSMYFRNAEEVSGAVYLITSCPKLQELTIECETVGTVVEPVMQFLRAQSVSCGVVKLLQSVQMCYFTGFEMEMEFMKFILACAPVLEEIFIWNVAQYFHRGTKMMDEIKQFCRVSPNVRFKFEEAFIDPELP